MFQKFLSRVLFLVSSILVLQCTSTTSQEKYMPLIKNSYFKIQQTDYDQITITSTNAFLLQEKALQTIQIGSIVDSVFEVDTTLNVNYLPSGKQFLVNFNVQLLVDQHLIDLPLRIRFIFQDDHIFDFDSTICLLKYPYQSTELFQPFADLPENGVTDVQDFDLDNRYLFYHPYGCDGLYRFDLKSGQASLIMYYCGGDFIAYDPDSGIVFMDVMHFQIWKYNLKNDSSTLFYQLDSKTTISGLAALKDTLYVIEKNEYSSSPSRLMLFNYRAEKLEEKFLPFYHSYVLEYYQQHFYTTSGTKKIIQYDKNFESAIFIPSPSADTETFRIWNGYLYFSDYDKQIIGRTKLTEIFANLSNVTKNLISAWPKQPFHENKNLKNDE